MNYKELANNILNNIGGIENVHEVVHCTTRLRFKLKDESKSNKEAIKKLKGIITVVESNGTLQIVVGNSVGQVYNEIINNNKISKSNTEDNKKKDKIGTRILGTISEIFVPILGALVACGLIKALLVTLTSFSIITKESSSYIILNAVSEGVFYFMPVMLAYTSAKAFKTSIPLALCVAGGLCHPAFIEVMTSGGNIDLFNIPVLSATYTSSVIPIIIAVYFMSKIEKSLYKIIPEVLKTVLVPTFTLLITFPLTIFIFGPFGNFIASIVSSLYAFVYNLSPVVTGIFIGAVWGILVLFGSHRVITPVGLNEIASKGRTSLFAFAGCANFAQAGAALGVALKTRSKVIKSAGMSVGLNEIASKGRTSLFAFAGCANFAQAGAALGVALKTRSKVIKSAGMSASLTAVLGITEPAAYGLNLPRKKPMIAAIIGGGIGGALMGMFGCYSIAAGTASPLTIPIYAEHNLLGFLTALAVSFVSAMVLTMTMGFEEDIEEVLDIDSDIA